MPNNDNFNRVLEDFKHSVIRAAKTKWNRKYDNNHHRIWTVAGACYYYNMFMD